MEPSTTSTNSTSVISMKEETELAAPSDLLEGSSDPAKTSNPNDTNSFISSNPPASGILHENPLKLDDHWGDFKPSTPDQFYEDSKIIHSYPKGSSLPSTSSALTRAPSLSSGTQLAIASSSASSDTSALLTPGQASLLGSLLSLGRSQRQTPKLLESSRPSSPPGHLRGPILPYWSLVDDTDSLSDSEDDPEGIRNIICRSLTPDPNTQDNALAFVLQSYARWVNFVVFEPLKVAGMIREGVIMQFASSPAVRARTCFIANIIGKLSKAPELDHKGMSIVSMLRSDAHRNIKCFHSQGPASEREVDMQNALRVLDSMMEMILIQRYSGPLSSVVSLMEAAAPVFRRACPEPPEKLVNLPNILASPGLNLQHFAATDVIVSVTTARPMFFKYDVECTPEALAHLNKGDFGLQWLHGVPDRFVVLLAWINALHEDHGDNVDPGYMAEIESQVKSVKIKPSHSPDPVFRILRLVVQECWRQTVYVYLYMVLCRARADDPRVMNAVRAFVNIANGVKPGRNPDSFLFIPIMLVGAFAYRERDRDVLRRRMMGLRECTNPSAASYDCLGVLEDIWRRTQAEDRPAVWLDLRISCDRIAGI